MSLCIFHLRVYWTISLHCYQAQLSALKSEVYNNYDTYKNWNSTIIIKVEVFTKIKNKHVKENYKIILTKLVYNRNDNAIQWTQTLRLYNR